jgi:hypothetical protein
MQKFALAIVMGLVAFSTHAEKIYYEWGLGTSYQVISSYMRTPTGTIYDGWTYWQHKPSEYTDILCKFENNQLQAVQLESVTGPLPEWVIWDMLENWSNRKRDWFEYGDAASEDRHFALMTARL